MDSLAVQPTGEYTVSVGGLGRHQACYRLLATDHVGPLKILGCHADKSGAMTWARRRDYAADYLIHAKHNRKLVGGEKRWDSVANQEPLEEIEFLLEATPQRKARQVRQTLTAQRVTLPKKKGKDPLEVTIIVTREETPPVGVEPSSGDY
ncbi:MAG: hypothetical protein NTW85_02075 [Methylococcales bacterium]|nr:hypothetical protein [Methylococcales bacterium]